MDIYIHHSIDLSRATIAATWVLILILAFISVRLLYPMLTPHPILFSEPLKGKMGFIR